MLAGFGLLEIFTEASKHQDPLQVTLDLTENVKDPTDEEIDAYSPEERGYFTSLYFAVLGNISAQRIFNQNLNDLVQQAKADDEALFNAILVDRRCLGCPTIVKRIQLATTQEDESFFNRLSKAITKTRPRRPMEEYDDLRFMLGILETCKTLSEFSSKRLYEVFVDELELYPFFGQHDSFEAFRKFLNRRRNR